MPEKSILKKILYVTPYYKPSWFYGGPPKCIAEQAEYLAQHFDCQIDVITLNKNGASKLFDSQEVVVKKVDGVTVHYLPPSEGKWGKSYFSSPQLKRYLDLFKSYEVVHIHALFNGFSTAGASFALKHGIPFGFSVHGMLDKFSLTRSKWIKRLHRLFYEDAFLSKADFVHFTTPNEKKNSIFPRKTKAVVIPLGIQFEEPLDYPAPYRRFDLNMVYLGRINRKKGLDLLLKALLLLPENMKGRFHLDIFGEDDDHFLVELQNMVKFHQLEETVSFLGNLSPTERNATLQKYDLLVLTSHQENFGLVVAEALDQKVPVLISDKVNLCDEVVTHECGWVSTLSPQHIAKKIEEAFRTPQHVRRRKGENGHLFVRNNYPFDKIGRQYWELYTRLSPTK
jgi:glycosyltransferase involved in cell wall biosynthesis